MSRPERRQQAAFGPFSPFAPLPASSPGAQHLLARAEHDAERLLHVLRMGMWAVAMVVGLFAFGFVDVLRAWGVWGWFGVIGPILLMLAISRRLAREPPSMALRYGLILLDGFVIARGVTLLWNPGGLLMRLAPGAYLGALERISPTDVAIITPPMLVFFAVTGAFRLEPRLAWFSTFLALAIYVYLRALVPAPFAQTAAVGAAILFAGALGATVARMLRFIVLKASEEQVLERYVPTALTHELARSGDPERAARIEEVSVLFADLRGFTRLSEQLTPAQAVSLLNEYFQVVVAPLAEEGAVLDKYLGDGLLAFFEGPGHAARALRAGRAILDAVGRFNGQRPDRPPLRTGIAIHAGPTLVGTIGAPSRLEYTVIGDVVNVTARLEEWNKRLPADLIVSEAALRLAGETPARDGLSGPRVLDLRGRAVGVSVHYLAVTGA